MNSRVCCSMTGRIFDKLYSQKMGLFQSMNNFLKIRLIYFAHNTILGGR